MLNKVQTEAIVKHLREIADILDSSCKNNIVKRGMYGIGSIYKQYVFIFRI